MSLRIEDPDKQLDPQQTTAEFPGIYDQTRKIISSTYYVPMQRYFDIVESIYIRYPENHKDDLFELSCNGFHLDAVKPKKDGRLAFFGGKNMNLFVNCCPDKDNFNWSIERTNQPTSSTAPLEYDIIGYKVSENDRKTFSCAIHTRTMPVIAYGRRNVLVYSDYKVALMWAKLRCDHNINVKTLPNLDHLVEFRQYPYKDAKYEKDE